MLMRHRRRRIRRRHVTLAFNTFPQAVEGSLRRKFHRGFACDGIAHASLYAQLAAA